MKIYGFVSPAFGGGDENRIFLTLLIVAKKQMPAYCYLCSCFAPDRHKKAPKCYKCHFGAVVVISDTHLPN